ncbi:MAG: type II secretion system protein [Blastocatellia bacterium]
MKKSSGFSLIELLIVTVIIGILSAIAVPNLVAARRAANEASGIADTRTVYQANVAFRSVNDFYALPTQLKKEDFLGDDFKATVVNCSLEPNVAVGSFVLNNGYAIGVVPIEIDDKAQVAAILARGLPLRNYYLVAAPRSSIAAQPFQSGTKVFYIDSISNTFFKVKKQALSNFTGICTVPVCNRASNYNNCEPADK